MYHWELKNWSIFSLLDPKFISKIHMAVVYGNLGNEALIVTTDGTVYGIGNNTNGCLGVGSTHSSLQPRKVQVLCEEKIKTFAYGKGPHVLALTENGKVYSWGHNGNCELGTEVRNGLTPALVERSLTKQFVVDIACGSHHSLVLTNNGNVYGWGQNTYGQVDNTIDRDNVGPTQLTCKLACKKIIHINCGHLFSMAVTDNGEVYGWGSNTVGQLGIGNCSNYTAPSKVKALDGINIEKVMCGYSHTLALSDKGFLYAWGENSNGQLGTGNRIKCCNPVKLKVPNMGRILDIATSHCHDISVAMGTGNQIFMWGLCLGQSIVSPMLTPLVCMHEVFACYAQPSITYQPLILHGEEEQKMSLIECLEEAFDNPTYSDFAIEVEGKCIYLHKAVLKIRCQYFRTTSPDDWLQNHQSIVERDQLSYDVCRAFFKFLYTDKVDLLLENMLELIGLAHAYSELSLQRRCIKMIKRGIGVKNVVLLYTKAMEYNSKELEESCFKFALSHMTAVVLSPDFAELDGVTIKTFIIKAAHAGAFQT